MIEKMLSIILPVFNAEKDIEQCLNNLLQVTYSNKELIIVDDGSSDRSPQIIDDYSRKYSFIRVIHKKNEGVQIARQVALQYVKGEYIAFIDADDGVDFNAYEKCIEILETKPYDVVVFQYFNEYGKISPQINTEPIECKEYKGKEIIDHFQRNDDVSFEGFLWNKIWRKSSIQNINFQPDLFLCSDVVFVWQALKQLDFVCFIEPHYYHYKYSQNSITKSSNIYKFLAALKAWKYIVSETKKAGTISYKKAKNSYVVWNIKTAEHLPVFSDNEDVINTWKVTKNNVDQNKECINNLPIYYRILATSLMRSKILFSVESVIINKLKKNFYRLPSKEKK